MFHYGEKPKARAVDLEEYFNQDNWNIEGVSVRWDICFVEENFASDHFRINHKDYYKTYMDNFKVGYLKDCSIISSIYEEYDCLENP